MDYNYIKIKNHKNIPIYILKVLSGSVDEILLVDMLFDNKVRFEKSTEEDFQSLVKMGGEMGNISGNDLLEEDSRQKGF